MIYDFDRVIDRRGTNCSKWDNVGGRIGNPDALPMWVADMDFPAPKPVMDAVCKLANSGIYGYSYLPPAFKEATVRWMKLRHGWDIANAGVDYVCSILPVLFTATQVFSDPGDFVILQQPVYYPFMQAVENQGRVISNNELNLVDGHYEIDFVDLEKRAADPRAKIMFLCSPHNPVGRVYTREELEKIGEICCRNHVLIVSDEVHSDFVYPGHKHIPMASVSKEIADNTITAIAPSKTFNTAGLRAAAMITFNKELRDRMTLVLQNNRCVSISSFGLEAYIAAYSAGEEYVDQLLTYLQGNIHYLDETLKTTMPKIKLIQPEGTYLMWLDCRELGLDNVALDDFITNQAAVGLDKGFWFGDHAGSGFMRMNVACPRAILEEAMKRLQQAYKALA